MRWIRRNHREVPVPDQVKAEIRGEEREREALAIRQAELRRRLEHVLTQGKVLRGKAS